MTNGKGDGTRKKRTKKKKIVPNKTDTPGTLPASPGTRHIGVDRKLDAPTVETKEKSSGEEKVKEKPPAPAKEEKKNEKAEDEGELRDPGPDDKQLQQDMAKAIQESLLEKERKPKETPEEARDRFRRDAKNAERRHMDAIGVTKRMSDRQTMEKLLLAAQETARLFKEGKLEEARRSLEAWLRLIKQVENRARAQREAGPYDDIRIGTEFTFTDDKIKDSSNERPNDGAGKNANRAVEAWRNYMAGKNVKIEEKQIKGSPAYTFTYPDGFWYTISRDDGCLETQAEPLTAPDAKGRFSKHLADIFETAKALKLQPDALYGGGHLSLDRTTSFGQNAKAFRNFLVNYTNQNDTWTKLDDDEINAPTIPELPREFRAAFRDIIEEFDRRYNSDTEQDMSLEELADRIEREVYRYARQDNQISRDFSLERHYQAINLEHLRDALAQQRIEMRRIRAQKDIGDFLAQVWMLTELRDMSRDAEELVELLLNMGRVEADDIPSGSVKVKK